MNIDEHVAPSGKQHYSATNKVPNIQEFMAQLDAEKKQRDAAIDAEFKKNKHSNEAKPHKNEGKPSRKDTRSVRDPVTGKDVEIRDVKLSYEDAVENSQVRLPLQHIRRIQWLTLLILSCPSPTRTSESRQPLPQLPRCLAKSTATHKT
jgi:hypothetical protein